MHRDTPIDNHRGTRALTCLAIAITSSLAFASDASHDYPIQPVEATAVQLTDRFWRPRIDTNRRRTIPYCFAKCEEYGRMENFRAAAGSEGARWTGAFGFNDSDVSKVIEGASACLMTDRDAQLEAYLDELIRLFADAQEHDGYLYTYWTAGESARPAGDVMCSSGREDRWGNIGQGHQLYNLGHMFEAAAAHKAATGKDPYVDICLRSAELLLKTFRDGGIELPPGHQEVELGLVKLYRLTGDRRLLNLAKYFLDLRGRVTASRDRTWGQYSQDHKPVTEQSEAVGHAVRAGYQYAAMADVAALTGDSDYRDAVDRVWEDIVRRKMHVTGGVGALHAGEAFGEAYELPNLTAYNETCAAIAQCYFNHRMFLLHGKAKYADVLERVLYNGVLSGVSYDGERFFYPNPLASDGSHARSEWFDCSCCPTNICRFIPAVPGYAYAVRESDIYVNLFAEGTARIALPGGEVKLQQATEYPWDGDVVIRVVSAPAEPRFRLRVRVPGWARNEALPGDLYAFEGELPDAATYTVGSGNRTPASDAIDGDGYLTIEREWTEGDTLRLTLPMPVRRVTADQRVEADRGRVALQRGPLVYCVEHPDTPDGDLSGVWLGENATFSTGKNTELCGGVTTVSWRNRGQAVEHVAIPYFAWAHRGAGEMAVWQKTARAAAPPAVLPGFNADPHIAIFGDRAYLYPTTDGNEGWSSKSFSVWSSADLVNWRDEGVILDLPRDLQWADLYAWAPAAATKGGKYYFYYTARQSVGVGVADRPEGPFRDPLGRPLVARDSYPEMQAIDPMVFVDDDGAAYLYWGQGRCKAVRLGDDMVSYDPTEVRDITPPGYNEGPFVHKRDGKYYLSWSEYDTRDPRYSVAYGVADTPLGPFEKAPGNSILRQSGVVKGAGHHSIAKLPGKDLWVIAYHRFRIPGGDGFHRETCLSPLHHDTDGAILPVDVFESVEATDLSASKNTD